MAAESILGGINQEATQQELLAQATLILLAILEKMPRVDVNDRLMVNPSESTANVVVSSGTVTTVSTVTALTTAADLTRLNNMGTSGITSKPADAVPLHLSNAGAMHIYNNILVSA
jgi:hypothetical protein